MKRSRYTARSRASSALPSISNSMMSPAPTNPGAILRDNRKRCGVRSLRTLTWPKPSTTPWSNRIRLATTSSSTRCEAGVAAPGRPSLERRDSIGRGARFIACLGGKAVLLASTSEQGLLTPLPRHTTRALWHGAPVAFAEAASDALLATNAAEKVLAAALSHRFRHLLPAVELHPRHRGSAARGSGRGDAWSGLRCRWRDGRRHGFGRVGLWRAGRGLACRRASRGRARGVRRLRGRG